MSSIMCTGSLLRRLGGGPGRARQQVPRVLHGVSLGPWAAKNFVCDGKELVLALSERCCATVVFESCVHAGFLAVFSSALAQMLEDAGLSDAIVQAERAGIEFATLGRLRNRPMTETLNDLQFFAEIELSYHRDLRMVQWNLNQLPRPNCEPCVPIDAMRMLYEAVAPSQRLAAH